MKQKKGILMSLGFIIILFSLGQVFGQSEEEIMKRYDYSSPKASFESYKKAIQEKDIEGVAIHGWQIARRSKELETPKANFKDAMIDYKNILKNAKKTEEDVFENVNRLWIEKGYLKITEVDFVKESESEHIVNNPEKVSVTMCKIIVERKSDRIQSTVMAYNFDGTTEWWIFNYPGGE